MALENVTASLVLDVINHDQSQATVKAIALDSKTRYVRATITQDGLDYLVDESATITLTILRPDNVGVQITGSVVDVDNADRTGTIKGVFAELTQAALAKSGNLKAQFKITSGEQILRTEIFQVKNGIALDGETAEWADQYEGYNLDEVIQTVNTAVATVEGMQSDVAKLQAGLSSVKAAGAEIAITDWIQGSIRASNGEIQSMSVACRSDGYIYADDYSPADSLHFTVADGYKVSGREWTANDVYVTTLPTGSEMVTGEFDMPLTAGHKYRFIVKRTNDTTLAPEDLPSNFLTYHSLSYTDATLTISGRAADARTVGDRLDSITDDLALMEVDSVTPISQWTQGSIAASTGANTTATTRCRSNGYFNQYTLGYGTIKISIASGFKLNARVWDERMSYVGGYPADWVTSVLELPVKPGYSYRFVIATANDSAITPSDIPADAVRIVHDGYTDMTLNIGGKSADAAAVRQVTMPYTAPVNAGTSTIIAAKTFIYGDGTHPVVDWYLLANYAGDLYISKDLRSKVRITRFTNWTQYKFAVRQNGDIIAVFRNEFGSAGLSYDAALDDVRQNPFVCLYSEGYAEWHEVDFGDAKKPCGWLENCGITSLPNGDVIFGEYTREMVVYTSNLWRIKASADITQASSWEVLKTFRVAENDSAEYDDTVIEHFHTVQVDPYTGTVYFATGDKGLKSQIWYSTNGGTTWTRQSFVDPDTSQNVTSGEKFFRLLNFNFTEDYVYWSSDSYSQHAVLRCERNGVNGFAPDSVRVLLEIAPTSSQAATYGTVLYPEYKIMVLMERLDASAASMLFRAIDLTTNTLKTICTIKSVNGATVHLGFRTEYTEFDPEDGIIKVGFSGNSNYRNYTAICGNAAENSFEKNINNLSIRISIDADRNVFARFGTYYI
jgi:hypothetical protein